MFSDADIIGNLWLIDWVGREGCLKDLVSDWNCWNDSKTIQNGPTKAAPVSDAASGARGPRRPGAATMPTHPELQPRVRGSGQGATTVLGSELMATLRWTSLAGKTWIYPHGLQASSQLGAAGRRGHLLSQTNGAGKGGLHLTGTLAMRESGRCNF